MTQDFETFMAELRAEFRRDLPEHDAALAAAWADTALDRLQARAHRLAGLGNTFGCPEISHQAERLELALMAAESRVELEDAVTGLRRAIAAAL